MSSQGMPTGYPVKPAPMPPQSTTQSGGSSGRIFGCAAIGCGGIILLVIGLCGTGYWALFYSSAPLRLVEQSLEQEGYVEIEGMKGNISTGVEMESFRFRDDNQSEEWSELKDVSVRYKTTGSMFNRNGIVIEKVNVASARFRVDMDEDIDFSGNLDLGEVIDEIAKSGGSQFKGNMQNGNIEIKQVLFQNIVLFDPDDGHEMRIDEVRFEGLKVERGELVHLGDITVRADLLEIQTLPSDRFSPWRINRRYEIRLKQASTPVLNADLPLAIDVGYDNARSISVAIEAFNGQFEFEPGDKNGSTRLVYRNFEPADFFSAKHLGVMPSAVSAEFERETGDKGRWQLIGDSGTLRLGKTTFQLQPGESKSESEPVFQAETEVDGQTVRATIRFARSLPLVNVDLASPADWKLPDLWAHTVFGNDFLDLDDPQKALVTKATEIQLLAIEAETKSNTKPASVETGEPSIDDSADDELDEAKGSDEPEADSKSDEEPDTKGV